MRKPGYSAAAPDGMPTLGQTWVQALASARCGDDPTVGKAKIVPDAKSGYSAAAPDGMQHSDGHGCRLRMASVRYGGKPTSGGARMGIYMKPRKTFARQRSV